MSKSLNGLLNQRNQLLLKKNPKTWKEANPRKTTKRILRNYLLRAISIALLFTSLLLTTTLNTFLN